MTIFDAAEADYFQAACIEYLMCGLSVIPCEGKKASIGWVYYQNARAIGNDVRYWQAAGKLQNVAIVCGRVSGNLVVMDLDGEKAVERYEAEFPHLLNTFTVLTGSGRGKHLYYFVDCLPPTTRYLLNDHAGIELRSSGTYVLAPPSIHPETSKRYEIALKQPVLKVSELNDVKAWLDEQINAKKRASTPARVIPREPTIRLDEQPVLLDRDGKVVRSPKAYAQSALKSEVDRLSRFGQGQRNIQLNKSAFRMAQFVTLGILSESEIEAALFHATRSWSDHDENEAALRKTIQSGLNDGQQKTDTQRRRI